MPTLRCRNVRRNQEGEERTCLKVLAHVPLSTLEALKSNEPDRIVFRCPSCKWVSYSYEGGQLKFDGSVPTPDLDNLLTPTLECVVTAAA